MNTIRIYIPGDVEYQRLQDAADELTRISPTGTRYRVDVTYFDLGQGWRWTTLIATRPDGQHYQALCPRDHEKIVTSDDIPGTIAEIVRDKYWYDRQG